MRRQPNFSPAHNLNIPGRPSSIARRTATLGRAKSVAMPVYLTAPVGLRIGASRNPPLPLCVKIRPSPKSPLSMPQFPHPVPPAQRCRKNRKIFPQISDRCLFDKPDFRVMIE